MGTAMPHQATTQPPRHRPRRLLTVRTEPELSPLEAERATVLGGFQAQEVATRSEVRALRRRLWGDPGATLSGAQATALVGSVAARLWSPAQFEVRDLPILGHSARLIPDTPLRPTTPGDVMVQVRVGDRVHREPLAVIQGGSNATPLRSFALPAGQGAEQLVWGRQSSVLGQVVALAKQLTAAYPWSETTAGWFLLTGTPPPLIPLKVTVAGAGSGHPRLVVEAQPWISSETVAHAFRQVQQDLIGHEHKPVRSRLLRLFEFITAQHAAAPPPSWPSLLVQWNERYPDWPYTSVRHLQGDVRRARRLLLPSATGRLPAADSDEVTEHEVAGDPPEE